MFLSRPADFFPTLFARLGHAKSVSVPDLRTDPAKITNLAMAEPLVAHKLFSGLSESKRAQHTTHPPILMAQGVYTG